MRIPIVVAGVSVLVSLAIGCQNRSVNPIEVTEHEVLVTEANYEEVVTNASTPVLLDFTASWCPPCHLMAPIVQNVAADYGDRLVVGIVDVDRADTESLSQEFRVANIPSFYIVVDGQPVATVSGAMPEASFREWVEKYATAENRVEPLAGSEPSSGSDMNPNDVATGGVKTTVEGETDGE